MPNKKGKPRTKRGGSPTPELTQEREEQAWLMRCQNYTQAEIAAALSVSISTICRALQRVRKREYVEFAKTREQHKIDQTRQIEHIASQAMRAWEKSKTASTRARETTQPVLDDEGEPLRDARGVIVMRTVTVQEAVEREGNAAYLYLVLKCLNDIRNIWGFDVLPAAQDVGSSLAGVIKDLHDRATKYEAEIKGQGADGITGGIAPAAPS